MDSLGVALMGAGGFLLYSAIRGATPWKLFVEVLTGTPDPSASTGHVPGSGSSANTSAYTPSGSGATAYTASNPTTNPVVVT